MTHMLSQGLDAAVGRVGRALGAVGQSWRKFRSERRTLLVVVALSVLVAQAESLVLVVIALVAGALSSQSTNVSLSLGPASLDLTVTQALVAALVGLALAASLALITARISARVFARIDRETRDAVFFCYSDADWESQAQQGAGQIQGLLKLTPARGRLFNALVTWVRAASAIAIFVLVAIAVNPSGAAVMVALGGVLSASLIPLRRATKRLATLQAQTEISVSENASEAIDQGADATVFGVWPALKQKWASSSGTLEHLSARSTLIGSSAPILYQYGGLIVILAVLVLSSVLRPDGVAAFAASALLLLRSVSYGQQLQVASTSLASWLPYLERLERSRMPESGYPKFGRKPLKKVDRIDLTNVSYRYPGAATPALEQVTVRLPGDGVIGLAGRSGSGKTTLGQLLLRLRAPTTGSYCLNRIRAEEYLAEDWHREVLHVPQQPRLLDATLEENIAFYDPLVSRQRVEEALASVGLATLVRELPLGLQTRIGPTLRGLSGGQVQRIGIARALARNPKVLVLDEPTSALDLESEQTIADAISELRATRKMLVVIIAHRPSTLSLCDEILVLDSGRLKAIGSAADVGHLIPGAPSLAAGVQRGG